MREERVIINNISKIYIKDPSKDYYIIYFPDEKIKILLLLDRIFLYFQTCKPILHNLENLENILFLIPNRPWNSHDTIYIRKICVTMRVILLKRNTDFFLIFFWMT